MNVFHPTYTGNTAIKFVLKFLYIFTYLFYSTIVLFDQKIPRHKCSKGVMDGRIKIIVI